LAPVRQENEKALERVKSKYDKTGCKAESSQATSPSMRVSSNSR
jgi:hypothetical protein